MRSLLRCWTASILLATVFLQGCGGGGGEASGSPSPPTAANAQPIAVSAGFNGQFPNTVVTSVTICAPGTGSCQTIPNVQVDTGSTGLRLLASAIAIPLPALTSADGIPYSECAGFADGVVWGPLARADVKIGAESAPSMTIQVVADTAGGPALPAGCAAQGTSEGTLALLGVNGILGVGNFLQDCGTFCAGNADAVYYVCPPGGGCSGAIIPLASQVSNPVGFFAQDNNGVVLQLPAIAGNGATAVAGTMLFGIGTQANNALTGSTIGIALAGPTAGSFTALYRGSTLANSFFDSGSNALYFDDSGIPTCPANTGAGDFSGFYCPGTSASLSATPVSVTAIGSNGTATAIALSVANALYLDTQAGSANLVAFDDLAGPAGSNLPGSFDFGLPFFFGRSVYTAFEQRSTPAGAGPYVAYQALP